MKVLTELKMKHRNVTKRQAERMELSRANLVAPGGHSLMEYAWYFDGIIQIQCLAIVIFIIKIAIHGRHDIWTAVAMGCAALASGLPLLLADGIIYRYKQQQLSLGSTNARPFMVQVKEQNIIQKFGMGTGSYYSELKFIAVMSIILAVLLSHNSRCAWFILINTISNVWILCSTISYSLRRASWLRQAVIWLS